MSMNFGGLGFSFAAEDTGAEKTTDAISDSLDSLYTSIQKIGPVAASAGKKVASGFKMMGSIAKNAAIGVSGALAAAVEQAQNPQLSSALEAEGAAAAKSWGTMTAGMNLTASEMKKAYKVIKGVSYGMNEDFDTSAEGWKAFEQAGISVTEAMGEKNMKGAMRELIAIQSTLGIDGKQLAGIYSGLKRGFGATTDEVSNLNDRVFAIGKNFNMGKEAIGAMPGIIDTLNTELAAFGKMSTMKDVDQMTMGIMQMGVAFKETGMAPEAAMEASKSFFSSIMGERDNIKKMLNGMGGEFSDFGKELLKNSESVDGVMQMMVADPKTFMDNLAKMTDAALKNGGDTGVAFTRLADQMKSVLGADATYLAAGNWKLVQEQLAQIPEVAANAAGSIGEAAKAAHKSGLTLQDAFERQKQAMEARRMAINAKERSAWAKQMMSGMNSTIGTIEKLANTEGVIGNITKKLLTVKDVGLSALVPSLGKVSELFGGVASSMLPAMTALGSMGIKFGDIAKYGLAGGGLAGLFFLLKNGPEESMKALEGLWDTASKFLSEIIPGFSKVKVVVDNFIGNLKGEDGGFSKAFTGFLKDIDFDGIKKMLMDGFDEVTTWIKDNVDFGAILSGALEFAGEGLGKLGKFISEALDKVDFGKVSSSLMKGLESVFDNIPFKKILDLLGRVLGGIVEALKKIVYKVLTEINWQEVGQTLIKGITGAISAIGEIGKTVIAAFFSKWTTGNNRQRW